jgi:ribosomal protein L40E
MIDGTLSKNIGIIMKDKKRNRALIQCMARLPTKAVQTRSCGVNIFTFSRRSKANSEAD